MKKLLLTLAAAVLGLSASAADVTFTFGMNNAYGLPTTKDDAAYVKDATVESAPVKMDLKATSGNGFRLWDDGLRLYKTGSGQASITVTATDAVITGFEMVVKNKFTSVKLDNSDLTYTSSSKTYSWTGSGEAAPEFVITQTGGNYAIVSIKVTYEVGGTPDTRKDADLSFPEEKYTVTIGEPFTAPELTKATPAAATYSSDKETVATVDATTGAVTIVGVGTARITATTEATDEYKAGTASYLLTVNKVVVPVDVELATTIADGKYAFFIPEHGVCKPITGSSFGYPIAEAVEVTDNKFTTNEDYLVTITNVADKGYTIKDVNEKYWGMDATHFGGINVYTDADAANSNCYWNIEFVDNTVKVANTGREGAYISFKNYNSDWELVTTDTADQPLPQLFKVYIPTSVAEIETAENAPVEYFNLQGVRVANPENGLYIRRQGNKVSKVIVK